jgi:hypothetical protein
VSSGIDNCKDLLASYSCSSRFNLLETPPTPSFSMDTNASEVPQEPVDNTQGKGGVDDEVCLILLAFQRG